MHYHADLEWVRTAFRNFSRTVVAVRLEPFLNQKHLKAENESRCLTQAFSCLKPARAQPTGGVVGSVRECALRHRQASHAYVRLCPRVVVHPLAPPGEQRLSSAVRER